MRGIRRRDAIIVLLFLASGSSGLVYEVIWMRQLTLVIGHTSFAAGVVVSAFLGGLSLGSALGGRFASRVKSPLRAYAAMELATGALALALTFALSRLESIGEVLGAAGGGSAFFRIVVTFALLFPPTIVMGATLPLLTRFVARDAGAIGRHFGFLYGTNTLGAAIGCIVAGFWAIGGIGLFETGALAACVNALVAAGALVLARASNRDEAIAHADARVTAGGALADAAPLGDRARGALVMCFGVAGFVSIAYEILWFRGLGLFLPSTAYAFAALLGVFLVGLVLGAALYSLFLSHRARDLVTFASSQTLLALVGLLSMLLIGQSRVFLGLARANAFGILAVAALVLLVPATIIGIAFPCMVQLVTTRLDRAGASVGLLYAFNTIGGIAGSLAASFILIPRLGTQGCFFVLSATSLVIAAVASGVDARASRRERLRIGAGAAIVLGMFVFLPRDWLVAQYTDSFAGRPLHVVDGKDGLLAVIEYTYDAACKSPGAPACPDRCADVPWNHRQLRFGSMSYATTALTGARYMTTLANLPMLVHPAPKQALVVCFGTGTTASTFVAHPELERLTIVDLNADVFAAADYFTDMNHGVVHDPKTHLVVDDGRHHLIATSDSYDVISFEPPPPITAGTVSLYTREFYTYAARRLRAGGLLTQWIPLDEQSDAQNKMLVRAMLDVFADVALFIPARHEAVLIASNEPLAFDGARMRERAKIPAVAAILQRVGFDSPEALAGTLVSGGEALRAWVDGASAVTDDLPAVEYPLLRATPILSIDRLLGARADPRSIFHGLDDKRLIDDQAASFELVRGADEYRFGRDAPARDHVAKAVAIAGANAYTDYLSRLEYDCMFPFR